MKKLHDDQDSIRRKWLPETNKNVIHGITKRVGKDHPYVYKLFCYSRGSNFLNEPVDDIDEKIALGYKFVVSTDKLKDDRKNSPDNSNESATVGKPVLAKTPKGEEFVLMYIEKEKEQEEVQKEIKANRDRYLRSIKGAKIEKDSDGVTKTTLTEINETNLGDSNDV